MRLHQRFTKSLKTAEAELHAGTQLADVLANIKATLTAAGFVVDYVEARTPELQKIEEFDQDVVLFIAAKLGATRLIDNMQVKYTAVKNGYRVASDEAHFNCYRTISRILESHLHYRYLRIWAITVSIICHWPYSRNC